MGERWKWGPTVGVALEWALTPGEQHPCWGLHPMLQGTDLCAWFSQETLQIPVLWGPGGPAAGV